VWWVIKANNTAKKKLNPHSTTEYLHVGIDGVEQRLVELAGGIASSSIIFLRTQSTLRLSFPRTTPIQPLLQTDKCHQQKTSDCAAPYRRECKRTSSCRVEEGVGDMAPASGAVDGSGGGGGGGIE
jgi:hypothetical protein